ncbi:MAG: alpha/beta hydrolase [Candidatus Hydrogenedentota bacterium]
MLSMLQTQIIFPVRKDIWRVPSDPPYHWVYEDVWLDVNGNKTHGWYIPIENANGTVLYCHGNGETVASPLESFEDFRAFGLNGRVIEDGGYGRSEGTPGEQRGYEDVRSAWRFLVETKGEQDKRIVVYGRSLGAAIAVHLASEVQPAALIMESGFTSITDMTKTIVPLLPLGFLVRHRFDSLEKIGNVNAPILIVHSQGDKLIPFRHGKRLFEAAREPKQFLEIQGTHDDGWMVSRDFYRPALAAFISRSLNVDESLPAGDDE